jgi:hypothetical protein
MLGWRNGNCRWSRLGKSGVEAYSDNTVGAVLRKTKNRRNVVLEIRILEGAGIQLMVRSKIFPISESQIDISDRKKLEVACRL